MRAAMGRAAVGAALVAVLILGLPLALAIRVMVVEEEHTELTALALRTTAGVGSDSAGVDPVEFPRAEPGTQLALYDVTLTRRAGVGPQKADPVVRTAISTQGVTDGQADRWLVVAVPVLRSEHVVGVVRAATPTNSAWTRTLELWGALGAAAALALTAASLYGRRRALALSRPIEALVAASEQVAGGDLAARAELSGVPEVDQLASTQNATVAALADLVERERRFTGDVSHQLRTPLARLQLALESAQQGSAQNRRARLGDALADAAQLSTIVDDLLSLARKTPSPWMREPDATVSAVVDGVRQRWHAVFASHGRRLEVRLPPGLAESQVPQRVADQVLTVLLDNALRHGSGSVTLAVRELGDAIAIDVADEGVPTLSASEMFTRGISRGDGEGIGLDVARSLAEAAGGRLLLGRESPTTLTWLLPPGATQAPST